MFFYTFSYAYLKHDKVRQIGRMKKIYGNSINQHLHSLSNLPWPVVDKLRKLMVNKESHKVRNSTGRLKMFPYMSFVDMLV